MSGRLPRALSRRELLATSAALALTSAIASPVRAAMGPDDKFDLVIKGGDVLDPSRALRGRRDIGIRYGVIEAVEPDIPAARALRVLDAGGKLVTPGLIDLHSHVYPYGSAIGIPADELVAHQCTTTCVSAGDAGANNFAAFRRFIVAQTRTRLYAFVHVANMGLAPFPVAELYNIDFAQVDVAAKAVAENADMVLGIKVRMSENVIAKHGIEPLKRAVAACTMAGTGDVANSRHAATRRHPHSRLFRRAQHRRRLHQHRAGRTRAAGGARGQATQGDLRRRPWRRQF
jgi:dihydroorotase